MIIRNYISAAYCSRGPSFADDPCVQYATRTHGGRKGLKRKALSGLDLAQGPGAKQLDHGPVVDFVKGVGRFYGLRSFCWLWKGRDEVKRGLLRNEKF